jgi:hypothetical protein
MADLRAENKRLKRAVKELVDAMKAVADRADADLKKHFSTRTTECAVQYAMFMKLIAKHGK